MRQKVFLPHWGAHWGRIGKARIQIRTFGRTLASTTRVVVVVRTGREEVVGGPQSLHSPCTHSQEIFSESAHSMLHSPKNIFCFVCPLVRICDFILSSRSLVMVYE